MVRPVSYGMNWSPAANSGLQGPGGRGSEMPNLDNRPISQMPLCTCPYLTPHAYFCSFVVYCEIWNRFIVGFVRLINFVNIYPWWCHAWYGNVFRSTSPLGGIHRVLVVSTHDDVIKWKHLPRNCPFVRGIHRSPVNSLHKGQWRGAFCLICVWIN